MKNERREGEMAVQKGNSRVDRWGKKGMQWRAIYVYSLLHTDDFATGGRQAIKLSN